MFEHAALGLKPSTTATTICEMRYYKGYAGDLILPTSGARCKLFLKSLTGKTQRCQKLPYNVDLLNWAHGSSDQKAPYLDRVKEIWAGPNVRFAFGSDHAK